MKIYIRDKASNNMKCTEEKIIILLLKIIKNQEWLLNKGDHKSACFIGSVVGSLIYLIVEILAIIFDHIAILPINCIKALIKFIKNNNENKIEYEIREEEQLERDLKQIIKPIKIDFDKGVNVSVDDIYKEER